MEVMVSPPPARLTVNRLNFTDASTIGELLLDKAFECYTLEDTIRRIKEHGKTAIPSGRYRLILAHSPKFGYCPWILDVPLFTDISIHPLNRPEETKGCIGVGRTKGLDWIGESRLAFTAFMEKLEPMAKKEDLWIEINGGLRPEEMMKVA